MSWRGSRRLIHRLAAVALAASFAVPQLAGAAGPSRRQAEPDAGTVRGPLSDFWFKVRSEWGGYLQSETVIPPGGGPLNQRTLATPPPNRGWVSLVYGDPDAGGRGTIRHLFEEFLSEWKVAEGRNWPYAQIYDRPWGRMGSLGLRQNIIMIGTPWALPPVGPLARQLGFEIAPGRIDIGRRKYRGDNLILVFIAPNPHQPDKYALVITGTNDEGLMQAGHLPYGETDYVLFRGRRLLESGTFAKSAGVWSPPESWQASGTHRGFSIRETQHYTFWYEPERLSREDLDALAAAREAAWPSVAALVPGGASGGRLSYYLYPSIDRKIDETQRDEVVHVDLATSEIHTVFSRTERVIEPWLELMVLTHRSGPSRVPRLERALGIALAPSFQGQDVAAMAARIFHGEKERESAVLQSLRGQDVMTPADGPPSHVDLLLAGFLQRVVAWHGREAAFAFLRSASPRHLDDDFEEAFGVSLGDAVDRWAGEMGPGRDAVAVRRDSAPAPSGAAGEDPATAGLELMTRREDAGAARLLEDALTRWPGHPRALVGLARIRFRGGDFDAAERHARAALDACATGRPAGCADASSWAHLTLGRVEALRGRHIAARLELTHPDVTGAAPPVPTLADYWLLTMGQSRNQLTVVSHLKQEARVALRSLDWKEAESRLAKALEIDPTDGEAHKLLSDVYHKHHEYWTWQVRWLNQIHPDYTVLSRIMLPGMAAPFARNVQPLHTIDSFNDLVLKGNLELLKAQSLYAVEIQNLHAEGDRHLIGQRDRNAALATYRRALELNPDFFLSHFLIGRCLFLMDRLEEARRSFQEVLARRPEDPLVLAWTHTYLGYIALHDEQLADAKRSFQQALAHVEGGKVGGLAREGMGKVETLHLLGTDPSVRR